MTTRTAQLGVFYALAGGATTTVYTGPTGYATIVKTLTVYAATAGASTIQWSFVPAGIGAPITVRQLAGFAGSTADVWQTWFVMEPGDKLQFYGTQNSYHVSAHGTQLLLT